MDCKFESKDGIFRYRVGAIIIENGCIVMAKNDRDKYYYSIGGAVKYGEAAESAIVREVYEETGEVYKIERLAFVHENFFVDSVSGQKYQELCLFFLMKSKGLSKFKLNTNQDNLLNEQVKMLDINKINDYFIFPTFFKTELSNLKLGAKHIVTQD